MIAALDRHLKEHGYKQSIIRDRQFFYFKTSAQRKSQMTLQRMERQASKQGKKCYWKLVNLETIAQKVNTSWWIPHPIFWFARPPRAPQHESRSLCTSQRRLQTRICGIRQRTDQHKRWRIVTEIPRFLTKNVFHRKRMLSSIAFHTVLVTATTTNEINWPLLPLLPTTPQTRFGITHNQWA